MDCYPFSVVAVAAVVEIDDVPAVNLNDFLSVHQKGGLLKLVTELPVEVNEDTIVGKLIAVVVDAVVADEIGRTIEMMDSIEFPPY